MPKRIRLLSILLISALAWLLATNAFGEEWHAEANVSVSETWTDNATRTGAGRSDWVTEINPGMRVSVSSARLDGSLEARLNNSFHTNSQSGDRTSLGVAGNGRLTLAEDRLFLDGATSVSKQSVSAFGSSSDATYTSNANQSEVRSVSLSPSAKFKLGNVGDVAMRYGYSYMSSDSAALSATQTKNWNSSLTNSSAFGSLGWFVSSSGNSSDNDAGSSSSSVNYRGGLTYTYTPDWSFQVFTGRESYDYSNGTQESVTSWGGGADWKPSPHSALSVSTSKHPFGWGYDVRFAYRFPKSSFTVTATKDVASFASQGLSGLYAYSSSYASKLELVKSQVRAGNPGLSEQEVTDLAMFILFAYGISPDVQQVAAALSSYSVSRQFGVSWVLSGVRNTLALNASNIRRDRIENMSYSGLGDLTNFSRVDETVLSLLWSHALTPFSSLSMSMSQSRAKGVEVFGAAVDRRQTDFGINFNTKLGMKTMGTLSYRHSRSSGSSTYSENAVSALLAHTF